MANARIAIEVFDTHLADFAGRARAAAIDISLVSIPTFIPAGRTVHIVAVQKAATTVFTAYETSALKARLTALADIT